MITEDQRESWDRDGFFFARGFAPADTSSEMLAVVSEICRRAEETGSHRDGPALIMPEKKLREVDGPAEERVSKVFRIHRQVPVFHRFCSQPALLDLVAELLGADLDCFLSQFIYKHPGALGQPWHQDSHYFPFDRGPQVGVWLAVTEAAMDNGPLWVLPGSHRESVHRVVPDRREHANLGYVEIVDHDMSDAIPVPMQPGDLLIFHSHLMHMSTDNSSNRLRAAMVYHYAEAGTVDHSEERFGFKPPNQDWLPVRRGTSERELDGGE